MDLLSLTKSRELAKAVWAATQSPELMSRINTDMLAKDENGELTIDSARAVFGLDSLLSDQTKANLKAKELGITDNAGNPVKMDLSSAAIDKAIQFNESQDSAVADVSRDESGKYIIKYEAVSAGNAHKQEQLRFKKDLNNRLVGKLNRIGIDVGFMNDPKAQGIFDPLNAERNADGLITMIKISRGEMGENALPEEIAHLIVRGLRDNVFRERMAKVLTPEAVKEYLGDRYDAYRKQYSNGTKSVEEYLQEEVMGQILAESLKGGNLEGVFGRFFDAAKAKFKGLTEGEIQADIASARKAVEDLARQVDETENLIDIIDPELLKSADALYSLADEIHDMGGMAMDHVLEAGMYRLSHRYDLRKDKMNKAEKEIYSHKLESIETQMKGVPNPNAQGQFIVKPTPLSACRNIAKEMIDQMVEVQDQVKALLAKDENGLSELDKCNTRDRIFALARVVNLFNDFEGEYIDWLDTLKIIDEEVKMPLTDAKNFKDIAAKANQMYSEIRKEYRDIRYALAYKLMSLYVGEHNQTLDVFDHGVNQKGVAMTIESMLRMVDKDSSMIDAYITSLGESNSPVLMMTHEVIYKQQAQRDRRINEFVNNIRGYQEMLDKSGETNSFMIDRDANGDKTGYFISPYDYKAFEEARDEFVEQLKEDNTMDDKAKKEALKQWKKENMIFTEVYGKECYVPNPTIYRNANFAKQLNTEAKRQYYDAVMRMKVMLDEKLPSAPESPFLAPQMRGTIMDQFDGSTKITAKNLWDAVWTNYRSDNDITDYGEFIAEEMGGKGIKTQKSDMKGDKRHKVPVFFTHKLKHMQQLNTDVTQSMCAYTAMAINFEEMDKINDMMFLLNQYLNSDQFRVGKQVGSDTIYNVHEANGQKYAEKASKREVSNITKAHTNFLKANLWGESKDDLGNIETKRLDKLNDIQKKTGIDLNMVDRFVSNWLSKTQLGFNLFSGWSNITQGEYQMLLEGVGGRFFNMKELGLAHKEFAKLEAEYLKEVGKSNPKNKLYHMLAVFNAKEDFFRDVSEKSYQKNKLRRFLDSDKALFQQSAGEHMLHAVPMIATLMHIKVKIRQADGSYKDGSLYDALEVREYSDEYNTDIKSYSLVIKEGTIMRVKKDSMGKFMDELTDSEGNQLMFKDRDQKDYIDIGDNNYEAQNLALVNANATIATVNRRMHGGYGLTEKGTASHILIMRYLMRFRQWMTATYTARFGKARYDSVLQEDVEGMYNTLLKFAGEVVFNRNSFLSDSTIKGRYKLYKDQMTVSQRENLRRAYTELATVFALYAINAVTAGWKDKRSPWAKRLAKLTVMRMLNEISAMSPTPAILASSLNLVRQPLPGIDNISSLLILLNPSAYFDIIDTGKYAGWPKAAKAAFELMPYKNVWKFYKFLLGENYIFNAYTAR